MIDKNIINHLSDISLTLFRKNFFGIYHGALSKKLDYQNFIINTYDAIFDEISEKSFCSLSMDKYDYSWKQASIDAHVHNAIYNQIHEAKYIACGMPPYISAIALEHDEINFKDYFGQTLFETIFVHDPGDFDSWYKRNQFEIPTLLKLSPTNVIVIKGIGVYVYDRDINSLVKKIAILENSARLLAIKKQIKDI